jgi:hypothetical protein
MYSHGVQYELLDSHGKSTQYVGYKAREEGSILSRSCGGPVALRKVACGTLSPFMDIVAVQGYQPRNLKLFKQ